VRPAGAHAHTAFPTSRRCVWGTAGSLGPRSVRRERFVGSETASDFRVAAKAGTLHAMNRFLAMMMFVGLSIGAMTRSAHGDVADAAAINQTALDFIEGWYDGDATRMARALHPDLAKRTVTVAPGSKSGQLASMTALTLLQAVKAGGGRSIPKAKQRKDITIFEQTGNAASLKITAAHWIDYVHLGRVDGRWVIINILWEPTE
jgi:hypothetical protein